MNTIKTAILMGLLTGLMIAAGSAFGGSQGAQIMLIFSIAMNFVSYWYSDSIVLKSYGAKEITRSQAPELYGLVEKLAKKANLPMPKVCIMKSETPNAFATGRNPENSAVVVTTGIMKTLNYEEMGAVISHELSHIKNHDTLISVVAASIAGVISMIGHIAQWAAIFGGGRDRDEGGGIGGLIFAVIIAPLMAMLIQMAISRSREFEADKLGGEICGDPLALASALKKLDYYAKNSRMLDGASPHTAHLFIVNPFSANSFKKLFSTHPPMEDRVAKLEAQAKEMKQKNGKNNKK